MVWTCSKDGRGEITVSNIVGNNDNVFLTVAATEALDIMIAQSRTGRHCEEILCRGMLRCMIVEVE